MNQIHSVITLNIVSEDDQKKIALANYKASLANTDGIAPIESEPSSMTDEEASAIYHAYINKSE